MNEASREAPKETLQQLKQALSNESYRFDGSASLRGDNFNHENIMSFTGVVNKNKDTYLRLLTAKQENGAMEDMDLYARGDQLYTRFADEVDWQPVSERSPLVEMEINHWHPVAHVERMQHMSKHIESVKSRGNIETIRVVLDNEALKNEFLDNIRARIVESDTAGRKELFRSLSTGQSGEHGILEEFEGLTNAMKQDFAELEQTLDIRGEYTIHYDKSSKRPTKIIYLQTTDFGKDGRTESEISETEITLTRYGEERVPTDLP